MSLRRPRLQRLACVLALVLLGGVIAPSLPAQTAQKSRCEVVKELLHDVLEEGEGSGWWRKTWVQRASGSPFSPFRPITLMYCGRSVTGVIDLARARKLATRLFRAYGYELEEDVEVDAWYGKARIDGLDREHKVGFELSGRAVSADAGEETLRLHRRVLNENADREIEMERPDEGLSADEASALRLAGFRILVGQQSDYDSLEHEDSIGLLFWVMSVVEFLNDVTDGERVPLHALSSKFFWGRRLAYLPRRLQLDRSTVPAETCVESPSWIFLFLTEPAEVVLQSDAANPPELDASSEPVWSAALSRISWDRYLEISVDMRGESSIKPRFMVIQEQADGRRFALTTSNLFITMPESFREHAEFKLIAFLPPGHHRISRRALVVSHRGQ